MSGDSGILAAALAAKTALTHWEGELRRVPLEPEPELVMAWLRRCAPVNAVTTLVHGVFKAGNVLVSGDKVAGVLDWETAHPPGLVGLPVDPRPAHVFEVDDDRGTFDGTRGQGVGELDDPLVAHGFGAFREDLVGLRRLRHPQVDVDAGDE